MKIQVTIDMELNLPDDAAREVARQIVESKGFAVARVTVPSVKGEGKPFIPKVGKPGSKLVRNGKAFTVWGDSPTRGSVWATLEGSDLYWLVDGHTASPYHSDGSHHNVRACNCGRVAA